MPQKFHLAVNCYTARCGETKVITCDRDSTIKMWYRLHQKRCATCKDAPFRAKADKHLLQKDKETLRMKDTYAGNPSRIDFSGIKAFTKVKDVGGSGFKQLCSEISKARRDGRLADPVIRKEYIKRYDEYADTIMKEHGYDIGKIPLEE